MASSAATAAAADGGAAGAAAGGLEDEQRERERSRSPGLDGHDDTAAEIASGEALAESSEQRDVSSQPQRRDPPTLTENEEISRLLREQRELRGQRKRVAQDLKNAQRRRKRLKHRARLLSNDDLAKVMALRELEQTERDSKAAAAASGGSAASSSGLRR